VSPRAGGISRRVSRARASEQERRVSRDARREGGMRVRARGRDAYREHRNPRARNRETRVDPPSSPARLRAITRRARGRERERDGESIPRVRDAARQSHAYLLLRFYVFHLFDIFICSFSSFLELHALSVIQNAQCTYYSLRRHHFSHVC